LRLRQMLREKCTSIHYNDCLCNDDAAAVDDEKATMKQIVFTHL
jgi:hypothetical protein